MSFEAEVIPMFIGGCIAVSALELAVGWFTLRSRKDARARFAGHVLSMALGLFFLVKCIFGNRLPAGLRPMVQPIASIDHSISIGLFGLCWTASVLFLLSALGKLNEKSSEN